MIDSSCHLLVGVGGCVQIVGVSSPFFIPPDLVEAEQGYQSVHYSRCEISMLLY